MDLSSFTNLGVGGRPAYYFEASTEQDLQECVSKAVAIGLPVVPIGDGSNLVLQDGTTPCSMIRLTSPGSPNQEVTVNRRSGHLSVFASAFENWHRFVDELIGAGAGSALASLTCIPGTVGGAVVQNIGAYGANVSRMVRAVRLFDIVSGKFEDEDPDYMQFDYRTSKIKREIQMTGSTRKICCGAWLEIDGEDEQFKTGFDSLDKEISYRVANGESQSSATRSAVEEARSGKGMVLNGDPDARSCGSFFTNPRVSVADAIAISRDAAFSNKTVFRINEEQTATVYAGALIEAIVGEAPELGIVGGAGLSTKHKLAIVNKGGATARDVLLLAEQLRAAVQDRFGVMLSPEPVILDSRLFTTI
jgi:UDP-N-acetylmuramate dehydrogenase